MLRFSILAAAIFVLLFSLSTSAQKDKFKTQAAVGNSAPAFTATTLSGKTYKSEDLNGKVVVLNFWSTFCPICAAETPELNKLVADYKNKDVVFIAFALNPKTDVEKFLKKKPFSYEIVPNGLQETILSYGREYSNGVFELPFPLHVVIDQKGFIQLNQRGFEGVAAVRKKLDELLKQ
jgi:peroxiredoxin